MTLLEAFGRLEDWATVSLIQQPSDLPNNAAFQTLFPTPVRLLIIATESTTSLT